MGGGGGVVGSVCGRIKVNQKDNNRTSKRACRLLVSGFIL